MDAKYLTKEKDLVEVQFSDLDEGLAKLVVEKLAQDKKVGFAATSLDHPLTNNPILRVKASSHAKEAIEKAVEKVLEEVQEAQKKAKQLD